MGCQSTKCKDCPAHVAACQMTQGRCPSCHSVYLDKIKQAQNVKPKTK